MKHFEENSVYDRDTTWFISDPHFGHDNVLKFESGYHTFASIEDHDLTIVSNWFSLVYPEDTVFFLGDAAMPRTKLSYLKGIFKQLPGKIVWVKGNHDRHIDDNWLRELQQVSNIIEYTDYKEIFVKCDEPTRHKQNNQYLREIVLFHYPIAEHNGAMKDTFHFYGHVHENVYPIKNAYPISACLTGYKPVKYEWVRDKIIKHNEGLDRLGKPSIRPVKGEPWRD